MLLKGRNQLCLLRRHCFGQTPVCRGLSSKRTDNEDRFHLGRQLSRTKIDPEQQQKWAALMGRPKWTRPTPPLDNFYAGPSYEIKGLKNIHKLSYDANVLLEIRDCRVPGSSHHPSFTRLAKHRLHLICYTHADTIDARTRDRVEAWTLQNWQDSRCIFVDSRETRSGGTDMGGFDLVYRSLLRHLDARGGSLNAALTVGIANTGKSSLLLSLLRTAKTLGEIPKTTKKEVEGSKKILKPSGPVQIHDTPGKTRKITSYLLREKPKAFFLDVPGMTPPKFFLKERPESWYGFGACNLLPLGEKMAADAQLQTAICDYVLHCANRDNSFAYVPKLGLDKPTHHIQDVLSKLSTKHVGKLNEETLQLKRCQTFLKLFNTGNFGPIILDDLRQPYENFVFEERHYHKSRRGGWK